MQPSRHTNHHLGFSISDSVVIVNIGKLIMLSVKPQRNRIQIYKGSIATVHFSPGGDPYNLNPVIIAIVCLMLIKKP